MTHSLTLFTRIKYMLRIYPELPYEQDHWDVFDPPTPNTIIFPSREPAIRQTRTPDGAINWKYLASKYFGITRGVDHKEPTGLYTVYVIHPPESPANLAKAKVSQHSFKYRRRTIHQCGERVQKTPIRF